MHHWMVPPEWAGETAFLIGCGPSLKGMDLAPLADHGRVIAINDSFLLAPQADVLYFCDLKWWKGRKEQVAERFKGRYIVTLGNMVPGVCSLRCTGPSGLETDPGGLRHGSNSGYQAINLAYHFGASRIVLLGYDMRVSNGDLHWNPRPERQDADSFQRTLQNVMLPRFQTLVAPLRDAGVEVLNCTPGSALECWPKMDLWEMLRNGDHLQF
jgi:hypothetical protein